MKLNRKVVIGLRNVGDAASNPEYHEGTLADCIAWMIQEFQRMTIAKRFMVSVARSKDECAAGLEATMRNGNQSSTDEAMSRIHAMLAEIDDTEDDDSPLVDSSSAERSGGVAQLDPEDTYQG